MTAVYDAATLGETPQQISAKLAQIKRAGGIGVARYLKKLLPNTYELTAAERTQILGADLGLLHNAEQKAGDLITQPTSYFTDYGKEVADLMQSRGVPTDEDINVALSCDTGVAAGSKEFAQVINNYDAFAAALDVYGVIGYAQTQIIDFLIIEEISPPGAKHWLPAAIAWSGATYKNADGTWNWAKYLAYPNAGMVQRLSSLVPGIDMNTVIDVTAMGFEWPAGSPYAPKKEDPMAPTAFIYDVQVGPNGEVAGEWLFIPAGRIYVHIEAANADVDNASAFTNSAGLAAAAKKGITYAQHLGFIAQCAPVTQVINVNGAFPPVPSAADNAEATAQRLAGTPITGTIGA